jgi:imidazolonepropionase-like amidohydrolase
VLDGERPSTPLEREIATQGLLASFAGCPTTRPGSTASAVPRAPARRTRGSRDNARRHQAGVTLFAGSDPQSGVFPGAGLHRELAQLAAAGSPVEVIRAATLRPARFLTSDDARRQVAAASARGPAARRRRPDADLAALDAIAR